MQDPATLLIGVGVILAATAYLMLYALPARRSAREQRAQPLLQMRCPLRTGYGFLFYFGGWGRVTFYDDFLVAVYLVHTELDYADIERAEYKRHLVSKGLFLYPRGGSPKYVALFPRHPEAMVRLLLAKGIAIEGVKAEIPPPA